ncbi:hypothetical protein Fuma_04249 [Fuerstiella marisgermanici]|uniref:Uncharacterized protein n=1 Tax=Fuerstiella marisgermanici TaxID=1891926 RepID=A0A1P8WKM6_9PLAN|nr:hypothetical protein Fuma_04249 [Fuerstiella marisgermanici]
MIFDLCSGELRTICHPSPDFRSPQETLAYRRISCDRCLSPHLALICQRTKTRGFRMQDRNPSVIAVGHSTRTSHDGRIAGHADRCPIGVGGLFRFSWRWVGVGRSRGIAIFPALGRKSERGLRPGSCDSHKHVHLQERLWSSSVQFSQVDSGGRASNAVDCDLLCRANCRHGFPAETANEVR